MINAEEFIEENAAMLHGLTNKYYLRGNARFSKQDLYQQACKATIKAAQHFDNTRGTKFSSFAYTAIYRELRDYVQNNRYDLHVPKCRQKEELKLGIDNRTKYDAERYSSYPDEDMSSLDEIIPSGEPPAIEVMIKKEESLILLDAIDNLPDKERNIIRSRFFENKKLKDIAEDFGCSRQYIHKLEKRAMGKLKQKLESKIL